MEREMKKKQREKSPSLTYFMNFLIGKLSLIGNGKYKIHKALVNVNIRLSGCIENIIL